MSEMAAVPLRRKKTDIVWHGAHESLEVYGFNLPSPMVYVQEKTSSREASAISLEGPVQPLAHFDPAHPFAAKIRHPYYYPSWQMLVPEARWLYLWWLSTGRAFFPDQSGYAFLFFYGLERRCLTDGADTAAVWAETFRLHGLSAGHYASFRHYAERFLWFLLTRDPEVASKDQVLELLREMTLHRNYVSEEVSAALHWFGSQDLSMPAEAAYHTAAGMNIQDSVVLQRAEPELRQLFIHRYNDRYSDGISIEFMPRRQSGISYYAANSLLPRRGYNLAFPNPLGQSKRFEKLSWLLNTCIEDLRRFSIVLGKDPAGRESPAAWEALPQEIRPGIHPSRKRLQDYLGEPPAPGEFKQIRALELASVLGLEIRKDAISADQARRIATAVDASGLRVEPDARLTGKTYALEDPLALFEPASPAAVDVSPEGQSRYQEVVFLLRAVRALTQHSSNAFPPEIHQLLGPFLGDPDEAARIHVIWESLRDKDGSLAGLRVPSNWTGPEREKIGRSLLLLSVKQGRITGEKEAVLRTVWKKLGLTPGHLTKELDALSARGVVFVGAAVPSRPGERLPPPPFGTEEPRAELKLDRATIEALLEDTRHVQRSLLEAMDIREDDAPGTVEPPPVVSPPVPPPAALYQGLPARFEPMLNALLERPHWGEDEARTMARGLGLMLAGGIEAINDWSVEQYGEPLIWEESDGYTIERSVIS